MSLVGLILTPAIILVATSDYRADGTIISGFLGIENFIFAFSLTGVAAVAYEVIVGRRLAPIRRKHLGGKHPLNWISTLIIVLGGWTLISASALYLFPINSVYAFMIGGLLVATYIIADRHDLLLDAIFSGLFLAILVFGLEQIFFVHIFPETATTFWQTERLSGFLLGGLPVEEIIWIAIVGLSVGPVYEFVRNYKINSN